MLPEPHIAGLDLGLVCTAVATAGRVVRTAKIGQKGITTLPLSERVDTIIDLGEQIVRELHLTESELPGVLDLYRRPNLVVIEAPDVSRGYGGLVERIQLYHEVVRRLALLGIPFATVPSPILKAYASGSGGVDKKKQRVMAAVRELWPEYGVVNDDESDAIVLAAMGRDRMTGYRRVPMAQGSKWLDKPSIQWPSGRWMEV